MSVVAGLQGKAGNFAGRIIGRVPAVQRLGLVEVDDVDGIAVVRECGANRYAAGRFADASFRRSECNENGRVGTGHDRMLRVRRYSVKAIR